MCIRDSCLCLFLFICLCLALTPQIPATVLRAEATRHPASGMPGHDKDEGVAEGRVGDFEDSVVARPAAC
eukprot:2453944-Alexandrium_andersonii.AAC.1